MKSILKSIIITGLFAFSQQIVFAQDADKTVTLIVTGQGKTIDEAKSNALRSAIEQAFGAFISSNTTILNDRLVKDEIVSVANGNIQKYDVLNETPLTDGSYVTTLKATVSVSKLTSFCESKGVVVEFKGGLFAMNIAMQELNEKSELKAWENTKKIIDELIPKCFEYNLIVSSPVFKPDSNKYEINISIYANMNKNYKALIQTLKTFASSASMSKEDADSYQSHGHNVFALEIDSAIIYLRNSIVCNQIFELPWQMATVCMTNFIVKNGIDMFSIDDFISRGNRVELGQTNLYCDNCGFVEYIKNGDQGANYYLCWDNSAGTEVIYKENGVYRYCDKRADSLTKIFSSGINMEDVYIKHTLNKLEYTKLDNFLGFSIPYLRDIEDIKKITEFKIELKK